MGRHKIIKYTCPNCGNEYRIEELKKEYGEPKFGYSNGFETEIRTVTHFCPNCNAKIGALNGHFKEVE